MSNQFTAKFFRGNRESLRGLFTGTAPIVLTGNGLIQSGTDETFPLHQDRSFWYLTGVNEPDAVLVIDKNKEYIILSPDYEHKARFDGAQSMEEIAEVSGVGEVFDHKAGWDQLNRKLKRVKHVATLAASPPYVTYYGFYSNPARATLIEKIKSINPAVEFLDLRQHLAVLRMTKQPAELKAIKEAIDITARSITSLTKKTWSANANELDVENELLYRFKKYGAPKVAFHSVIAAGANTPVIHHRPDKTQLVKNNLLLIDAGAEVNNYAADISRVFVVGKPSRRVQQVYTGVESALQHALGLLKPGVDMSKFEKEMERIVGEKLRELGLIKTIDRESVRRYFPTYTSHHLGLDTHDVSDHEKLLRPNMVLAVEPGIYIPEEGIGIRIEENVVITPEGNKVLTAGLSPELLSLTMK